MSNAWLALLVLIAFVAQAPAPGQVPAQGTPDLPLNQIKLPPGFSITLYATGVDNARSLARERRGRSSSAAAARRKSTRSSIATGIRKPIRS